MAKICNSRSKLYEIGSFSSEEPPEHVESEGDKIIKQMVQKQLNTQANLQQELNREQCFNTVTEIVPLGNYISGVVTLKKFEETTEKVAYIEELKSLGLSNDEIQVLNSYESEGFQDKSKNKKSSFLSSQFNDILIKVEQARKNKRNENKSVGARSHEKEIGLSVKPDSEHTKLLNFVLSCKKTKPDARPPDHPINQLITIEQDLFSHLAKRRKKSHPRPNKRSESRANNPYLLPFKSGESLWDVKGERENNYFSKKATFEKSDSHVYTCKPERLYTVQNGEIIPISESDSKKRNCSDNTQSNCEAFVVSDLNKLHSSLVPLETISENRLSSEGIRSLSKFSNYTEGTPSEVLYIKNLNRGFSKDNLISLFGHFESSEGPRITYRLMNGRMKGQAFVTFPTRDVAKKALELVNGYKFNGKPIIIQYSRSK